MEKTKPTKGFEGPEALTQSPRSLIMLNKVKVNLGLSFKYILYGPHPQSLPIPGYRRLYLCDRFFVLKMADIVGCTTLEGEICEVNTYFVYLT